MIISKSISIVLIIIAFLFIPTVTSAHPGNTDVYGCHTCRTNCPKWGLSTGEYHCHRAKTLPQPEEPIRSHNNGTTELWPEYKKSVTPVAVPKRISPNSTFVDNISPVSTRITYVLARGMENGQVTLLQQTLAKDPSIYPEGLVTGYFGLATEQALKAFQRKYGLDPVGYTGPKTRTLLNNL